MNFNDPPMAEFAASIQGLEQRIGRLEQMIHSNARSIAASTEILGDMKTVHAQTVKNVEKLVGSVLALAEHLEADQARRQRILDILVEQVERESQFLDSLHTAQQRQSELLCFLTTLEQGNQS